MVLLHNRLLRWRPVPRVHLTLFQLLTAAAVLALTGGLAYREWARAEVWAAGSPQRVLMELSAITANLFEYLLPLLLLPLNRNPNGLFPYLFATSWEHSLVLHKRMGDLLVAFATVHSVCEVWVWCARFHTAAAVWQRLRYWKNLCGLASLVAMLLLRLLAIPALRRRYKFEWFRALHVVLTVASFVLFTLHCRKPGFAWKILSVPVGLWALDIAWRLYSSYRNGRARVVAKTVLSRSHATVLELEVDPRGTFSFEPGTWAFLCIPALSRFQFHPFAILASTLEDHSEEETAISTVASAVSSSSLASSKGFKRRNVVILAKNLGDWTQALEDIPLSVISSRDAFLQGPVGRIPFRLEAYKTVVMIGAGCAIAPAIGLTQRIYLERQRAKRSETTSAALIEKGPRAWLILTVQFRDLYAPFAADIAAFASDPAFRLSLYESGPNGNLYDPATHVPTEEEVAMVPVPVKIGMPNIGELLAAINHEAAHPSDVAVIAAGPPVVQNVCVRAC
jgi:hypothetical protein